MPLYDYRCQECDHEVEALQTMSDAPLTLCPNCQKEALKKMVSAPAFSFKGDGWYKDLYGKPAPKVEKSEKTATTTTTTESASKTETSKPAKTAKAAVSD